MKILAIRGQNLASLAGTFEVDLMKPPLAGAGLFTIIGPTGAGKSTLLDAMCLALYDETPRLGAKSSVFVGDPDDQAAEKLSASDVRSILRKGTVSGYAEVDFLGQDGKRHRARWSVRRAHANVKKSFMPQTMTLEHLETGERAPGTKKEILAQIETLVGLSFEQFRRSALLPQGDFAAFLQAKGPARAELLEKVTGTELYGRISVLAFERAKVEKNKLDEIEAGRATLQLLSVEQRAEIGAELARTHAALREDRAHFSVLRDALTWFQALEGLTEQLHEASSALTEAEESWKAVQAEHANLADVEAAQTFRAPLEAVDQADRMVRAAREELVRAEGLAAVSAEEFERTRAALGVAQAALDARVTEEATAQPKIARARALDAELLIVRRALSEAESIEAARSADAEAARVTAGRLANDHNAAEAALRGAEASLARQAKNDRLADEWPRWREAIQRASSALTHLAMVDLPLLADAERKADIACGERVDSLVRAERALDEAQTDVTRAEQSLTALDPEAVRRERAALDERKLALASLVAALHNVQRASEELAASREHEATARRKQVEAEGKAQEGARERERVAAKLEAAQSKLEAAQAVRDLESYRALLADGEACPLCGAHEHPFGKRTPRVDDRIEKANVEVARWTEERTALDRAIARSWSKVESEREAADQHASAATRRAKELNHRS